MLLWDSEKYSSLYSASSAVPAGGVYTSNTCALFPRPSSLDIVDCELVAKDTCHQNTACDVMMECVSGFNEFTCKCPENQLELGFENKACSSEGLRFRVVFTDTAPFAQPEKLHVLAEAILERFAASAMFMDAANVSLAKTSFAVDKVSDNTRHWSLFLEIPLEWITSTLSEAPALLNASCSEHNFTFTALFQSDISDNIQTVDSSGLHVLDKKWVDDAARGIGWLITVRIPAPKSSHKLLYLSKTDSAGVLQGLSDSHRPCRFTSEAPGLTEQCCMAQIAAMFHIPSSVAEFANCSRSEADLPTLSVAGAIGPQSSATVTQSNTDIVVDVFLSYHDAETGFASKTVMQGALEFDFFIGVANIVFFEDYMATTYTQNSFHSVVTTTYTFTSESTVTNALSQNIDIQMVRVQDPATEVYHDFVFVSMRITQAHFEFVYGSAVQKDSATFGIGYTAPSAAGAYMCPQLLSPAFPSFQSGNECSFQHAVCSDIMDASEKNMLFVFPLGSSTYSPVLQSYDQESTAMLQKLYLDFFVQVRNTENNKVSFERVQTSSQIFRHNMQVQCARAVSTVKLQDLMRVDMVGGFIKGAQDLNASVSYFQDVTRPATNEVCDEINPDSICLNTPEVGLGSMTYLVLGKDTLFGVEGKGAYELRLSGMFSIYFLSEVKRIKVRNLIQNNRAFVVPEGSSLENSPFLVPSEELLQTCPLQTVKGNYGCISRFEVEDTVFDFVTSSITSIANPRPMNTSGVIYNQTDNNLYNWIRTGSLGESDFMQDYVRKHSSSVIKHFHTNDRYRRAFVQSNQLPWTASSLQALNVTGRIDLVQDTFSFMLVTMHSSFDQHEESVYAKVRHSASMPVECSFWDAHPYLQNMYVDVYVFILGLNRKLVSVAEAPAGETDNACMFFVEIDLPYQDQARALAQGQKMANEFNNPFSILSQRVELTLRDAFMELERRIGVTLGDLAKSNFRGSSPAVMIPYHSTQSRRRASHTASRVLQSTSVQGDAVLKNLSRNESLFASEITSRRYKDVNSADIMAQMVESDLVQQGRSGEIQNGTSRLAVLTMLVPRSIACLSNESLAMQEMQKLLENALKLSTTASVASITPTSFVILDSVDCSEGGSRRRLLQQQYFSAHSEMVFTPAKAKDTSVVITPERVLRKLPGGVKMLSVTQAVSLNPNAINVKSSWIGDMPPDGSGIPSIITTKGYLVGPENLMQILSISLVCSLLFAILNFFYAIFLIVYYSQYTDDVMKPSPYIYSQPYQQLPQPMHIGERNPMWNRPENFEAVLQHPAYYGHEQQEYMPPAMWTGAKDLDGHNRPVYYPQDPMHRQRYHL
tara:strand:- start:25343 stop:29326 length:3984 start_codon:yes stop_codon:yes gene_type:complete